MSEGCSSLGHKPEGRWSFDAGVTAVFDDMLARSIPAYADMRGLVADLASAFLSQGGVVVDLGCSRGEVLAQLAARFKAKVAYVGVDCSPPMIDAARERLSGEIREGWASIQQMDLRADFPPHQADVLLSVLTLQFTPIERRPQILASAHRHLKPGGAFILVEKVLGRNGWLDRLLVERYYALKAGNGYSPEEIEAKRQSLEGALVPVTAAMNEEFLRGAGFGNAECFWRWCNFAGWIAIKE